MVKAAVLIDTWFPLIGGGQVNAYEIAKRLARQDIAVDIITRNNGNSQLALPTNLKIAKLGKYSEPYNLLAKIIFLFRSYFYIYRRNYNLVHAHAFLPGLTAKALQITKKIPIIFTVHGTFSGTLLNNFFQRFVEKIILTKITYNAQITVSRDFLKVENRNKNIIYIPNGVELNLFDKASVKKLQNPTLLFVGRLHPQKNLLNLIKAIYITKNQISDIKLIIVGDGPQKEFLKKMISKLKLAKSVKLVGELEKIDLVKLYKSAHLFILPSIYEGQPLTLLEAWAAKLPVITSKTGDCQFLVKNGVNGYLIDNPQDVPEIASLIKKTLESKNLLKMGQNGYNLVTRGFSWEKSVEKTLKVYESLTKAKN